MGALIKVELYKFIKNKKNLLLIAVLFLYTLAMVIYNYTQSAKYMDDMSTYFKDRGNYSAGVSATLQLILDNEIFIDEDPELIESRIEYYALEARSLNSLAHFYKQNKDKDYKYINKVMNKLYSSTLNGYYEGIIKLEEIEQRGDVLREIKILSEYTKYIADEDIQPILNKYEITGANGMKLFLNGENLIVLFILIGLLVADIYLKEMSEGSYKLLLTQPYERKGVYLSKTVAAICVSIALLSAAAMVNFTAYSLIGGIGNWNYPMMSRIAINILSTNGLESSLHILPLWEFVLRGFILLIPLILFTIMTILMISILTDSNSKTLGITIIMVSASFALNAFLRKTSAINLWYPHSYLFIQNVLEVSNRSSYIMGMIICTLGTVLSFVVSYRRFNRKDFLGSVD